MAKPGACKKLSNILNNTSSVVQVIDGNDKYAHLIVAYVFEINQNGPYSRKRNNLSPPSF